MHGLKNLQSSYVDVNHYNNNNLLNIWNGKSGERWDDILSDSSPYSKRANDSFPVLSTDISLSRHPLTKSHVPEDGDFINGRSGRQNLWVCRAISRASVLCWGVGRPSCILQELCCKDISERVHDAVGWSASTGP